MFQFAKQLILIFFYLILVFECRLIDIYKIYWCSMRQCTYCRNNSCIWKLFCGLQALLLPYKEGGVGSNGKFSKQVLFVNLFSLLSLQSLFWILIVSWFVGSAFEFVALPSCSFIFFFSHIISYNWKFAILIKLCTLILYLITVLFNVSFFLFWGYLWFSGLNFL